MSHPFQGRRFTFTQPNGRRLDVRGWGDQYRARFETLDGVPLIQNPHTGFYEAVHSPERSVSATTSSPLLRGGARWEQRRQRNKSTAKLALDAAVAGYAPPTRRVIGNYVGVTVPVQFSDAPASLPRDEIDAFCNQAGYAGANNHGSVYDYFFDVSGGRLRYSNIVAPYFTAHHPRTYYTDEGVPYGVRARELVEETLAHLSGSGIDPQAFSADDEGYVYALNVLYAGEVVNNEQKGLWPHTHHLEQPYPLGQHRVAFDYQITNTGHELMIGVFCHENGHMLCDFPDLYDGEVDVIHSFGAGYYCLMANGCVADEKNPVQVCAYLKLHAGWADSVGRLTNGMTASLTASSNSFLIHTRCPTEYFIIEYRCAQRRDAALPASGLAIWHGDERGDNSQNQMNPAQHYECALVQADGRFDLEQARNQGDAADLYGTSSGMRFGPATLPSSRWWDGSASGLEIYDIEPVAGAMAFKTRIHK